MTESEALIDAITVFGDYLHQIKLEQWTAHTPDTDWNVRQLVHHNLDAVLWIPDLVAGKTMAEVGDAYSGDIITDNPGEAWDRAAAKAKTAIRQLTSPDQTVHLSFGDYSARDYFGQQSSDLLIHAWDLANAIGASGQLDPELVEAVYGWFAPQADGWRDAGLLGPAIKTSGDANTQTKLLALSGRTP